MAGITDTSKSPNVKLRSVDMDAVRWSAGFWADRFQLVRGTMIESMWKVVNMPNNGCTFATFRIAAGAPPDANYDTAHSVTPYSDGDFYKWLEAVAHVYSVTHEPELDRRMDSVIAVIAKAQEPDGYISTPVQIKNGKRWERIGNHELYNMGHLMTAACIHHRATGKDSLLKVATKCADYLCVTFFPRPPHLAHFGFNPSQVMGLVELSRTTGDENYLKLAAIFVENRGSQPGGTDQNQDVVSVRTSEKAVGHAVTGAYLWAGTADLMAESRDPELHTALDRLWENVALRKTYITGAIGSLHSGLSSDLPGHGDPVRECFGLDYQLPNRTAYNETCANIANAMWNWRMLSLTGDAKYADVMERVFYNSMLSGVSLSGTKYFYTNVLRRDTTLPLMWNDTPDRWPNTTDRKVPIGQSKMSASFCCPPNAMRTMASIHEYAYSFSDKAVWVNLYGSNELKTILPDGRPIELNQTTDYPWDGKIDMVLGPQTSGEFTIHLRIPEWAEGADISVNGASSDVAAHPGTYAAIARSWRPGDHLQLDLPMKIRTMAGIPQVDETWGQVAVMRGPVVYCIESPDLPSNLKIDDIALAPDSIVSEHFERDLLNGVVAIQVSAKRISPPSVSGALFQRYPSNSDQRISLRMIPYYAWSNRGIASMSVWLPFRS
ncbi:MAG TPA: glycoside hydrolase family 127 protein [Edaphobacter sp.]|uniref:glycoside hydrolase family 127 protein n=1 Tax=Edaphobacter sp. TaxID=1934404 RepID=UPI002B6391B3|nr:glycoside hydrolase family 127 protein [Edaphobacter sp.]HUZ95675.1 glycoside hydrolase family 127 protein [Edaphobacter sp.]